MKKTALYDVHVALRAKMVPFAGYEMPVQYEGVNAEHEAVRNAVGVFDVSHMGEFFLKGEKALDLIQRVGTNDASKIEIGKAQYTCMPNGKGGIVDDLIVYRMAEHEYLLVVNASNIEKDWNWIAQHNTEGVVMTNESDDYSLFAVQGPKTIAAIQSLTDIDLTTVKPFSFVIGAFAGCDDVIISGTGYTGSGGFELYFKNEHAQTIWDALFEAGKSQGIKPIGLAARDTLRLEMGFCLYGNDIDDTTSPIEAGLGWVTKFTKDFVDADLLKKQKEEGVTRKLVAFELIDRGIPRHEYDILDEGGKVIGVVTSGTMSPSLKKAIGLGYVTTDKATVDGEIFISIRDKGVKAKIVKLPFYKN
jgi:aminomethyltransferase